MTEFDLLNVRIVRKKSQNKHTDNVSTNDDPKEVLHKSKLSYVTAYKKLSEDVGLSIHRKGLRLSAPLGLSYTVHPFTSDKLYINVQKKAPIRRSSSLGAIPLDEFDSLLPSLGYTLLDGASALNTVTKRMLTVVDKYTKIYNRFKQTVPHLVAELVLARGGHTPQLDIIATTVQLFQRKVEDRIRHAFNANNIDCDLSMTIMVNTPNNWGKIYITVHRDRFMLSGDPTQLFVSVKFEALSNLSIHEITRCQMTEFEAGINTFINYVDMDIANFVIAKLINIKESIIA